jgi:hypothetical protein
MNTSRQAFDDRSTLQIIMERALLGFVPVEYAVEGDDRWHTVKWAENPALDRIKFSDGTVVVVDNNRADSWGGDEIPWREGDSTAIGNANEEHMDLDPSTLKALDAALTAASAKTQEAKPVAEKPATTAPATPRTPTPLADLAANLTHPAEPAKKG